MADVRHLLALFPEGCSDQVPHGDVARALLANPRNAYLRSNREWLDQQMAELLRLEWVVAASGPRGGKAWRLTDAGRRAMADWRKAESRRQAAAAKSEAKRREAEIRTLSRQWEALSGVPGLGIDGAAVVVTATLTEPADLERLARGLRDAADIINRRRLLKL